MSAVAAKPYHHGDLRHALVVAATRLLDRGGVEALSLRAAAREAGVTHAAPYRHFADKAALLAAVAERGFVELEERLVEAQAAEELGERLRASGVAYVRFAMERPARFRLMFGAELADRARHPALAAAATAAFDRLATVIVEGQRAGFVAAGEPREIALAAWSLSHGAASLLVESQLGGAADVEALVRRLGQWLHDGIGA